MCIHIYIYTDDTEHAHPPMDPACVDPRPVETVDSDYPSVIPWVIGILWVETSTNRTGWW